MAGLVCRNSACLMFGFSESFLGTCPCTAAAPLAYPAINCNNLSYDVNCAKTAGFCAEAAPVAGGFVALWYRDLDFQGLPCLCRPRKVAEGIRCLHVEVDEQCTAAGGREGKMDSYRGFPGAALATCDSNDRSMRAFHLTGAPLPEPSSDDPARRSSVRASSARKKAFLSSSAVRMCDDTASPLPGAYPTAAQPLPGPHPKPELRPYPSPPPNPDPRPKPLPRPLANPAASVPQHSPIPRPVPGPAP